MPQVVSPEFKPQHHHIHQKIPIMNIVKVKEMDSNTEEMTNIKISSIILTQTNYNLWK
jgi:hypothetical protein